MATKLTLQTQSGGVGSYAFNCYLTVDADCNLMITGDAAGTYSQWRIERIEDQDGSDIYRLSSVGMNVYLGVKEGIVANQGILTCFAEGSGNHTLWRSADHPLGLVTLQTQYGGVGDGLYNCYLSVDPNSVPANGRFIFTPDKVLDGKDVATWNSILV